MVTLLIIILVLVLLGGGAQIYRGANLGTPYHSLVGIVVLILLIALIFGPGPV